MQPEINPTSDFPPVDVQGALADGIANLKLLRNFAGKLGFESDIIDQTDELLARLEQKRFSVAVMGELKCGKSLLINALLGEGILPCAEAYCSATVTRITFDKQPAAKIVLKGQDERIGEAKEVDINQLAPFITRLTSEFAATAATVREAVVFYPTPFCDNKVGLFDTPGLSGQEAESNKIALSILPKVDVVILTISPEIPFSGNTDNILKQLILSSVGRVIFVVTGVDRLPKASRQQALEAIRQRLITAIERQLERLFGRETEQYSLSRHKMETTIFALSSYYALQAKLTGNAKLLAGSGFARFETRLKRLLTQERDLISLQVLGNHIATFSSEILAQLSIQASIQRQQQELKAVDDPIATLFTGLQQMAQAEIEQLDTAVEQANEKAIVILDSLTGRIKRRVIQAIASAPITATSLEQAQFDMMVAKLSRQVSRQVENDGRALAEQLQMEIHQQLLAATNALYAFVVTVEQMAQHFETQASSNEAKESDLKDTAPDNNKGTSIVDKLGGLWSEYQNAVNSYSTMGRFADIGAAFGAGILADAIDLPYIATALLPTKKTQSIFPEEQPTANHHQDIVGQLKAAYQETVMADLGRHLKSEAAKARHAVETHIRHSFALLKQEIDTVIDETRRRVEKKHGLEPDSVPDIAHIRAEVQNIRNQTYHLLKRIRDV